MRQTIFTVILVILLAVAGYLWLRSSGEPGAGAPPAPAASERLAEFQYLRNLKPDLGLFSDPRFRALEQTVPSIPAGRLEPGKANPFNPL
ncbi:MAG: hypothetical protein HY474_02310 [Candidatus Sungbacteria bacterium]|uniref:Uncharacterized protein n=1 Tax=Candidatus Sungiibacteriota bacterium TaxID=2750080 RepID=A0A932YYA6_9BACT|nr:hypothetical protein [Candidatus Sungbacteria bacterium]